MGTAKALTDSIGAMLVSCMAFFFTSGVLLSMGECLADASVNQALTFDPVAFSYYRACAFFTFHPQEQS